MSMSFTTPALACSVFQVLKMIARLLLLVIAAKAQLETAQKWRRKGRLGQFRVDCGIYTLQLSIQGSASSRSPSARGTTKLTAEPLSTCTETTSEAMDQPAQAVSSSTSPPGECSKLSVQPECVRSSLNDNEDAWTGLR